MAFRIWLGVTALAALGASTSASADDGGSYSICTFSDAYGEVYFSGLIPSPAFHADLKRVSAEFNAFVRKTYDIVLDDAVPNCHAYRAKQFAETGWIQEWAGAEQTGKKPKRTAFGSPIGASPAQAQAILDPDSAPGLPLRFVLVRPLRMVIGGNNGSCYSNIVTIDGTPGWRVAGASRATEKANAKVAAYFAEFDAKCAAVGPAADTAPPVIRWNSKGSEDSPDTTHATMRKNGMAEIVIGR